MSVPRGVSRGARSPDAGFTGLHGLFEAQARRSPDAPAVVHGVRTLTYADLDGRAGRLAAHLRAVGVARGSIIAVCASPSIELLVSLIAVLKAGGAYLPIDPATPRTRLADLLAGSRPSRVLVDATALGVFKGLAANIVVVGDDDTRWTRDGPLARGGTAPEELAYVIQTSGSTGVPKGVMVPHRGICNTLRWRQATFPFQPEDRVLLTLSFTFDASLIELFQPLMAGACVVIPDEELAGDPGRVVAAIRRHAVTVIAFPTSFWRLLLAEPDLPQCTSLRIGFCGGDPLTPDVPATVDRLLGIELHNMYGPTEASMEATYWTCVPGEPPRIGRPIDNMAAYLLDDNLRPAPAGGPGELYLSGAGIARGYLNDPALTAIRFLPDAGGREPGARMYRTGDVCRRLPNGDLDFVGRRDRQVKVHGHRIELEEIEAVILDNAAVREGAVVLRGGGRGDGQLVAYVVPSHPGNGIVSELRRHLRPRLPIYMIPRVVAVTALPRTATGKIDRLALSEATPDPRGEQRRAREAIAPGTSTSLRQAPRRALERYLIGLWEDAIHVPGIGTDDDVFDLGGDSISVAVVAHRLEADLGEVVHTVALYDATTVRELADYLRRSYPRAVSSRFGEALDEVAAGAPRMIDEAAIRAFDALVRRPSAGRTLSTGSRNPPAVFVLSAPRSGSTLLRVMLGGHPSLFAPPELQLLNFNTLAERRNTLASERDRFWLQGTIRALMEAEHVDVEAATRLMEDCERRDLTVKAFYALLQSRIGDATLVDKTPNYALDERILRRAEEDFDQPRYIHLVRHPSAMIASFEEARLQVFFRPFLNGEPPYAPAEMAELVWLVSNRNIAAFLAAVPPDRQHRVRFEDLVRRPKATMEALASFVGLPYGAEMVDPYRRDPRRQMTDPIRPLARMLGDVKFHQHGRIDPAAAERPSGRRADALLGSATSKLAGGLGYALGGRSDARSTRAPHGRSALFLVPAAGGSIMCYRDLSRSLDPRLFTRPFEPVRPDGDDRVRSVEDLAARHLADLRGLRPRGPYRLAGWSFGGLVAFEIARRLEAEGEDVELLAILSGHLVAEGARLGKPKGPGYLEEYLRQQGVAVPGALVAPDAVNEAYALARRAGVIAPGVRRAEFRQIIARRASAYAEHVRIGRRYRPHGTVRRLVLLEPAERTGMGPGPFRDWDEVAGRVSRHTVPGDHFSMMREPHVGAVAEWLTLYTGDVVAVPVAPDRVTVRQ